MIASRGGADLVELTRGRFRGVPAADSHGPDGRRLAPGRPGRRAPHRVARQRTRSDRWRQILAGPRLPTQAGRLRCRQGRDSVGPDGEELRRAGAFGRVLAFQRSPRAGGTGPPVPPRRPWGRGRPIARRIAPDRRFFGEGVDGARSCLGRIVLVGDPRGRRPWAQSRRRLLGRWRLARPPVSPPLPEHARPHAGPSPGTSGRPGTRSTGSTPPGAPRPVVPAAARHSSGGGDRGSSTAIPDRPRTRRTDRPARRPRSGALARSSTR